MPTVRTPSFPFGKAMPADFRIRNSPVVFKFEEAGCSVRLSSPRTMAAIPFAQTTYHARSREDLQRGTSTQSVGFARLGRNPRRGCGGAMLAVRGGAGFFL
jgi:hypothetical protein